jgi:membrane-bound serine protease (ClpP class)
MHDAVAFFAGICAVLGILLIVAAITRVNYTGLDTQTEVAMAIIVLALAVLAAWMLYKGLTAKAARVKTGQEALIGAQGIAVTDLKPKGEIRIMGEFWQATTEDKATAIASGETVKVLRMEGMFLVVKPVKEKA